MIDSPVVTINEKDYNLKITLGFYKMISFPREEMQSIYTNGTRLIEVLKLAIYFANKKSKGWNCLGDLDKEITESDFELIEDRDIAEKIGTAIFNSFPDALQNSIKESIDHSEEDGELKKK